MEGFSSGGVLDCGWEGGNDSVPLFPFGDACHVGFHNSNGDKKFRQVAALRGTHGGHDWPHAVCPKGVDTPVAFRDAQSPMLHSTKDVLS
jgi:hypothetical protein